MEQAHSQTSVPKHGGAQAAGGSAEAQPRPPLLGVFPVSPATFLGAAGFVGRPSRPEGTLLRDPVGQGRGVCGS